MHSASQHVLGAGFAGCRVTKMKTPRLAFENGFTPAFGALSQCSALPLTPCVTIFSSLLHASLLWRPLPRCAWGSPGVHLLSQSQSLIVTLSLAQPSSLDGKLCMPLHLWSAHCVPDTVLSPGEMENGGPCPASKEVLIYWGICSESHDLASQAAPGLPGFLLLLLLAPSHHLHLCRPSLLSRSSLVRLLLQNGCPPPDPPLPALLPPRPSGQLWAFSPLV